MSRRGSALTVVLALLGALLLGVGVPATALPAGPGAAVALPTGTTSSAGEEPFAVTLDGLAPSAPRPDETLVLSGRVRAEQPLSDVTVRLRVGRPVTSRSGLAVADSRLLPTSSRTDRLPVAEAVPAGTDRAFQVSVPASDLRLEDLGAHPLHVEVRARVALDSTGEAGADDLVTRTVQTFLPTFPDPVEPTRLAVLLPLTSASALAVGSAPQALVEELAPGGRLHGLLEAGAAAGRSGVAVTWAVDPALVDAVLALAATTATDTVGTPGTPDTRTDTAAAPDTAAGAGAADTTPTAPTPSGSATPAPASSGDGAGGVADPEEPLDAPRIAEAWLSRARDVLRDAAVLALPYADADVVAAVRDGLGDEVALAVVAGREEVADGLGVVPLQDWAWPPQGLLTPDALAATIAAGQRRLVLDPVAVDRASASRVTPDARVLLEVGNRELEAVTTDPGLTALLAAGATGPERDPDADSVGDGRLGDALAVQRLAAETALLTAERPGSGRAAVLAPPRLWDVDPSYVRRLLTGLATQSWLRTVPLPTLVETAERPASPRPGGATAPAETTSPAGTTPPTTTAPTTTAGAGPLGDADSGVLTEAGERQAAEQALPPEWVLPVTDARRALGDFAPVLTEPEALVPQRRLALLRAISATWRRPQDRGLGRVVAAEARQSVAALLGAVRVEGGGPVLFTAETGTIPLTVVNELGQPVRVQVAVDAAGQARLLSGAVIQVEIEPGRRRQVDVRVAARTSGQFPVLVRLRSPEGVPLGDAARVTVRSTAYGRVALAITVGAAAVLVAAAGVRLLRRAWRAHRTRDGRATAG